MSVRSRCGHILTVTSVWNTGETGDIFSGQGLAEPIKQISTLLYVYSVHLPQSKKSLSRNDRLTSINFSGLSFPRE